MKYNLIQKIESSAFIVTIFLILYVLIYNLFHYDPINGYDGIQHHAYVQNFLNLYVPGKTIYPSANFTSEFFSPPLPYILPAFVNEICKMYFPFENILETCQDIYSFVNIIFQSLIYLCLLFLYMKIVKLSFKNKKLINISVLLIIGLLTVNYKAIAMLRAETYIIFLNGFLLYRFLVLINKSFSYNKRDIFLFGTTIGLMALSRQWAFLLFPAYFLIYFIIKKEYKLNYLKFLVITFFIGFLISSWFYIGLFIEYGSFTTFNQDSAPFSLKSQPLSFYIPNGDELHMLFTKPIRPYFKNQFLPTLYADLWGDYWGYFSFTSLALDIGRNQMMIGDYLARVNIVSLFPTFLLILGFKNSFKSLKIKEKLKIDYFNSYLVLASLFSLFGFLWFLISYPSGDGDTNKGIYIIQLFHLLGLMAVLFLEKIKKNNKKIYLGISLTLFIIFLHNLSAMMSHFPQIELFTKSLK